MKWFHWVCAGLMLAGPQSIFALAIPVAVSPGSAEGTIVSSICPSFSWSAVEGANGYDLVIYRLDTESDGSRPVVEQHFDNPVFSWTPPASLCFDPGGRYAWAVRAHLDVSVSDWSVPHMFKLAAGPSREEFESALTVVREYLQSEAVNERAELLPNTNVPQGHQTSPGHLGTATQSVQAFEMLTGDSALQVNGSPVVTEAGLGTECIGRRWLDQGDGTVLDCNTRKVWLKDADCLGTGTWDGGAAAGSAQAIITNLNDIGTGRPFPCTDYVDGSYTDWQLPSHWDFCSMVVSIDVATMPGEPLPIEPCRVVYYATSMMDVRFGYPPQPLISNTLGTGLWAQGDPFVDVSDAYWTVESTFAYGTCVALIGAAALSHCDVSESLQVWAVRGPD